MNKLDKNFTLKDGMLFIIVATILFFGGKCAYIFLPPEYAKRAQIPTLETILTVVLAYTIVEVFRIKRAIRRIEKQFEKDEGEVSSNH